MSPQISWMCIKGTLLLLWWQLLLLQIFQSHLDALCFRGVFSPFLSKDHPGCYWDFDEITFNKYFWNLMTIFLLFQNLIFYLSILGKNICEIDHLYYERRLNCEAIINTDQSPLMCSNIITLCINSDFLLNSTNHLVLCL